MKRPPGTWFGPTGQEGTLELAALEAGVNPDHLRVLLLRALVAKCGEDNVLRVTGKRRRRTNSPTQPTAERNDQP